MQLLTMLAHHLVCRHGQGCTFVPVRRIAGGKEMAGKVRDMHAGYVQPQARGDIAATLRMKDN